MSIIFQHCPFSGSKLKYIVSKAGSVFVLGLKKGRVLRRVY
jgi:hypothetical protein